MSAPKIVPIQAVSTSSPLTNGTRTKNSASCRKASHAREGPWGSLPVQRICSLARCLLTNRPPPELSQWSRGSQCSPQVPAQTVLCACPAVMSAAVSSSCWSQHAKRAAPSPPVLPASRGLKPRGIKEPSKAVTNRNKAVWLQRAL